MTPERRAELLEELDRVRYCCLAKDENYDTAWMDEIIARNRALLVRELDEADPEPDSGTTLGLEARGGAR